MFKVAAEENINNICSYVTELKERVTKLQYQKQLLACQVRLQTVCSSVLSKKKSLFDWLKLKRFLYIFFSPQFQHKILLKYNPMI